MSYVVLAEFDVAQELLEDFLTAARRDSEQSVAREPGCLRFDINLDKGSVPARVMFYEVYTDSAAFAFHLTTDHLAEFQKILPSVTEKPARFFEQLE